MGPKREGYWWVAGIVVASESSYWPRKPLLSLLMEWHSKVIVGAAQERLGLGCCIKPLFMLRVSCGKTVI